MAAVERLVLRITLMLRHYHELSAPMEMLRLRKGNSNANDADKLSFQIVLDSMTVTPIAGEVGRYMCQSTPTSQEHLVDILEDACGCAAFTMNHRRYKQTHNTPLFCKHLVAAREYALNGLIEVMKENALAR
jgi:hypothetical protein